MSARERWHRVMSRACKGEMAQSHCVSEEGCGLVQDTGMFQRKVVDWSRTQDTECEEKVIKTY